MALEAPGPDNAITAGKPRLVDTALASRLVSDPNCGTVRLLPHWHHVLRTATLAPPVWPGVGWGQSVAKSQARLLSTLKVYKQGRMLPVSVRVAWHGQS